MKKVLATICLLVLLSPCLARAESVPVPTDAVKADDELTVSIASITYNKGKVTVTFDFRNDSGHEYSFGWAGGSHVIVRTDAGNYAREIRSVDDSVELFNSTSVFSVDNVSGALKTIEITGISPLGADGLPIFDRGIKGSVTLDPVVFTIPVGTYVLVVESGTGTGEYKAGDIIDIEASVPKDCVFDKWEIVSGDGSFDDYASERTTFKMSAGDAEIVAKSYPKPPQPPVSNGSAPGEDNAETNGESHFQDIVTAYTLTVNGGSGAGKYEAGDTVDIEASVPEGYVFDGWGIVSGGGSFGDAKSEETTYVMPAGNAAIEARFAPKDAKNTDNALTIAIVVAIVTGAVGSLSAAVFKPELIAAAFRRITGKKKGNGKQGDENGK
jgi:hypothetical protein